MVPDRNLTALPTVLVVGVLLSQLISNVPLVALYLPVLQAHAAAPEALLALDAGSTIAGNLLILGLASNVIIVQRAERRGLRCAFSISRVPDSRLPCCEEAFTGCSPETILVSSTWHFQY